MSLREHLAWGQVHLAPLRPEGSGEGRLYHSIRHTIARCCSGAGSTLYMSSTPGGGGVRARWGWSGERGNFIRPLRPDVCP